jgi:homoserine kinase
VPRADAIFNLQRVVALVHALQHRDYAQMREAVRDRLHQPARAALVPVLSEALAVEDPDVVGAFLSGAGPSVAMLARDGAADRVAGLLRHVYERAGVPATVRVLRVHEGTGDRRAASQERNAMKESVATMPGRTA